MNFPDCHCLPWLLWPQIWPSQDPAVCFTVQHTPPPRLVRLGDFIPSGLRPPTPLSQSLPALCPSAATACAPHGRGWRLFLWERTPLPTNPASLQSQPPSPPPPASGASPPGSAGGAHRPGTPAAVSPAALRCRGVRLLRVGAPAPCPPVWGSRAGSAARWESRGRAGRGGAGSGRKRRRRDYETRPARSWAHCSPPDWGGTAPHGAVGGGLAALAGWHPCAGRGRGGGRPSRDARSLTSPPARQALRGKTKRSPQIPRARLSLEIRGSTPPYPPVLSPKWNGARFIYSL